MTETKVRDQAYIKQSNIHSVLRLLQAEQPISRKDLARLAEMSPTSITRIVNTLLERSLILEEGRGLREGRGRRAIPLTTNPDGLYTLGIYIDRLLLLLCVQNFEGQTLYTDNMPLEDAEHSPAEIARSAYGLFKRMPRYILQKPEHLAGIGISVPGIVDHRTALVKRAVRMRWNDVNLRTAFENVFGLPAWLENDVKAGLIGEKKRLNIPADTDAAYLYLGGSGISTSLTSGGKLVRGEDNAAGEVAHIVLSPSDAPCDCGQHGCLQLHLVEAYLIRRAQKIDPSIRSMEGIIAAYRQRLAWAEVLLSDFRRHLQLVLSLLDSFLNPKQIIVSGDIFSKLGNLIDEMLNGANVIFAPDYQGASVTGVAMIAMEQALIRRLSCNDED